MARVLRAAHQTRNKKPIVETKNETMRVGASERLFLNNPTMDGGREASRQPSWGEDKAMTAWSETMPLALSSILSDCTETWSPTKLCSTMPYPHEGRCQLKLSPPIVGLMRNSLSEASRGYSVPRIKLGQNADCRNHERNQIDASERLFLINPTMAGGR